MCDPLSYLTHDVSPNSGPELDTVYIPGTPGAPWSEDEIKSTRLRILQVHQVPYRWVFKVFITTRPYIQIGTSRKTCTTWRGLEGQASLRTESWGWFSMTVSNIQVRSGIIFNYLNKCPTQMALEVVMAASTGRVLGPEFQITINLRTFTHFLQPMKLTTMALRIW